MAAQLKVFEQGRHVICVGPAAVYRHTHVPNALLAGPDSKPKGLALLSEVVKNITHDATQSFTVTVARSFVALTFDPRTGH